MRNSPKNKKGAGREDLEIESRREKISAIEGLVQEIQHHREKSLEKK